MDKKNLKTRLKLYFILEAVLIPVIFIIALIVNLAKGREITHNLNLFYYLIGVLVMVTSIPSLYRRPYSQKGIYRKMMGEAFLMKKPDYEESLAGRETYEDDNPFITGLVISLSGLTLILVGFIVERAFNII